MSCRGRDWSRRVLVVAATAMVLAACGGSQRGEMRDRAAIDLRCREGDVELEERGGGRWRASGCGRRVAYVCEGGECELRRRATREQVDPTKVGRRSGVRERRGRRRGAWRIQGVVPARPGLEMEIVATTRRPARVMVIVRNQGRPRFHWCQAIEVSVDGTWFSVPRTEREVDGDGADAVETVRGTSPITVVERMAEGREVRGRLCTMQFAFHEGAASTARALLERLRERTR
ncbi:MAG: hypothetical protein IT379_00530 [Deltaproteobacteria bacterium]|nr:hypothetical protein [Deltaproteobacteria bacterium]